MKRKKTALAKAWERRLKLMAKSNKLIADGNNLLADGDKIRVEGYMLMDEGDRLWLDAVKDANLDYDWTVWNNGCDCKLSNGDVYRHDQKGGMK